MLVNYIREFQIARGVAPSNAYTFTMYILVAFLGVGLICNLAVRPVSQSLFTLVPAAPSVQSQKTAADAPAGEWGLVAAGWLLAERTDRLGSLQDADARQSDVSMSPQVVVALGVFVTALASSAQAQTAGPPRRPFHVIHYDARIEPDIPQQTIRGSVRLDIVTTDDQNGIDLDRGSLVVDSVREGRIQQTFTLTDRHLLIQLSHPIHSGEKRTLEIDYHGAPRFGLRFVPDRSQAYTVFSTSQWMVCVDAPEDRSTLRLRVIMPRASSVIASGQRVGRRVLPDGTIEHEWRTTRAVPTYTFGLAAGRFNELVEKRGGVTLRYLADGFSTAELRRIFRDTSRMIAFFQERAGVPYDGAAYTQVLVAETIGQEMAGFAILPESFGRTVLSDERSVALGAHELAHQWWGNMVTCRNFSHFWLNEGFATFMAAAYR